MKIINNKKRILFFLSIMILTFSFLSCGDGKDGECPVCDNKTQVLNGNKCVDINTVAECGPDGHSHGANEPCHCFSGQKATLINGKKYCLQTECTTPSDECSGHGKLENGVCHCKHGYKRDEHDTTKCVKDEGHHHHHAEDIDKHACESKLETEVKEATDKFNGKHIDLGHHVKVQLLKDKEGYIHFPMEKSGDFTIYVSEPNLLVKATSKNGEKEFAIENKGANKDCKDTFKAVYHIKGVRQNPSAKKEPLVLIFKASDKKIAVFAHRKNHEHGHGHGHGHGHNHGHEHGHNHGH